MSTEFKPATVSKPGQVGTASHKTSELLERLPHAFLCPLPQILLHTPTATPQGLPRNSIPHPPVGQGSWYLGLGWGPPKDTQWEKCGKGSPNPGQAPSQLDINLA